MAKISCTVSNCSYNQGSACYASSIKVGGESAKKQEDTCCGSFLNQIAYSNLTDSASGGKGSSQIFCDVASCKHHSAKRCELSAIRVGGSSTSEIYTQTDCLSFEKK